MIYQRAQCPKTQIELSTIYEKLKQSEGPVFDR
jgi:hypothetical protein